MVLNVSLNTWNLPKFWNLMKTLWKMIIVPKAFITVIFAFTGDRNNISTVFLKEFQCLWFWCWSEVLSFWFSLLNPFAAYANMVWDSTTNTLLIWISFAQSWPIKIEIAIFQVLFPKPLNFWTIWFSNDVIRYVSVRLMMQSTKNAWHLFSLLISEHYFR